jgi:hypothetical protein
MSNNKKQKRKGLKVKIPKQDLTAFLYESLEIDPFWHDLYGITNGNTTN